MSRFFVGSASVAGGASWLLVDSAVKGAALLVVAALAALALRRDSAATRHLVWLLAIVALLVAPALSMVLPTWRALPSWAAVSVEASSTVTPALAPAIAPEQDAGGDAARFDHENDGAMPTMSADAVAPKTQQQAAAPIAAVDILEPSDATAPSHETSHSTWTLAALAPAVWAMGCGVLLLRLGFARWLLRKAEASASAICVQGRGDKEDRLASPSAKGFASHKERAAAEQPSARTEDDRLVAALQSAKAQLGVRRPIVLLVHPGAIIPGVWGIVRRRLMLPAAARTWSDEQLRSVMLHEVAHIKRCDTLVQLLAQIACAMHWFNPLAWVAVWRIGVERERACDDLVLASGVRPSVYAGHLLEVVTGLSSARWTQSCGLAMARRSSLEGRLVVVLSGSRNRRRVSTAIGCLALLLAAGAVVPIAMLRAADGKPDGASEQPSTEQPAKDATSDAPRTKNGAMKLATPRKISAEEEARLRWGEAVGGLRAAVVIRTASGKPAADEAVDLYLVVQNVAKAPIRLADSAANPALREMYMKRDQRILAGFTDNQPMKVDCTLAPGEAVYLRVFVSEPDKKTGKRGSELLAGSIVEAIHESIGVEFEIKQAAAGAWTGKLKTADVSGAVAMGRPAPKTKQARELLFAWQDRARSKGEIPGGLIAMLADKVQEFVRNNTGDISGDPYARKMAPLAPRLDASHDWKVDDVVKLLDDIAAASTIPLETTREAIEGQVMRVGPRLTKDLENAPWGAANASGLRMAWLLEPRAKEYRINTPLKSRIILHNTGKDTIVLRTRNWHQSSGHKAHDATGKEITVTSTYWTTIGRLKPFRLSPGDFVEVIGAGIGVGANKDSEDWRQTRVGSWIEAKAGDDVTFTPDAVPLKDWDRGTDEKDGDWWLAFITSRLRRDLPLPTDAAERTRLLERAMMDLFGVHPTAEENAAFVADREAGALESLAKRLAKRPGTIAFSGSVESGPTTFHVLPVDPDAAKRPRTANNPGQYSISPQASFVVSRRGEGERIVNEAKISFATDPTTKQSAKAFVVKLPDGYDTWAAAWVRGTSVLWVQQGNVLKSFDFADPAHVKEVTLTTKEQSEEAPKEIVKALAAVFEAAKPKGEPPATSAK